MILLWSSEHLRDQRSLEDVQKFFEIKGLSGILERSLPTKIIRGSSEELRVQRSSKDLRKIFEMKTHSRIFARSSRSKIIQGSSDVLQYRRALKDFRKIYEIKDHSRTFGTSSISNIIQGSFCNSLPQNTRCYFRRAILLSFGHRGLLVDIIRVLHLLLDEKTFDYLTKQVGVYKLNSNKAPKWAI